MPDSHRPPSASSAAPSPPAAPAPGSAASPGGQPGRSRLQHAGEVRQRGVEQQHVLPAGALLRAEDVADAPCSPISGLSTSVAATSAAPAQPRARRRAPAHAEQRGAAVRQGVAGRVQRGGAERGEHPGAAVVGGRAAEADDDLGARPASTAAASSSAQAVRGGDRSGRARPRRAGAGRRPGRSPRRRCRRRPAPAASTGRPSGSTVGTGTPAPAQRARPARPRSPGPPSASGRRTSVVAGAAARQPVGDRRGRLDARSACRRTCPDRSARARPRESASVTATWPEPAVAAAVGPSRS